MICLHGYDKPEFCSQCPKEAQETQRVLMLHIEDYRSRKKGFATGAVILGRIERALERHEGAVLSSRIAQLDVQRERIKSLEAELVGARRHDAVAIGEKLDEILMRVKRLHNA